jgi:uncharacterized protein (DUF1684 family)
VISRTGPPEGGRDVVLLVAVLLAAIIGAPGCTWSPSPPDESEYLQKVLTWRADRDRNWSETTDPIPAERRAELLPLKYYPPDPSYVVPAALRLADEMPVVELPTSTGELRKMQIVGTLEFTLNGQQLSLGALSPAGEPIRSLFVPFADATTKVETYEAGRYLDIEPTATGLYTIDFNYAYNPTCAYNEAYSCPFPPPSNRLKIAVRAGEKAPGAKGES